MGGGVIECCGGGGVMECKGGVIECCSDTIGAELTAGR